MIRRSQGNPGMQSAEDQDNLATASSPTVQVFALGGFRVLVRGRVVEDHAWRRKTARQLFKCLLSRPSRRMTRDEVVELLWPESDPEAASSNLRSTIHALRRAVEPQEQAVAPGIVFGDRDSVWLRPDDELWLDADAFERTVQQAWRSSELPLLEQASRLYAGHYLPEDLYEDWATERREALKQYWAELQIRLSQELERRGDPDEAARRLQRLLQVDRCDERAAQEAMQLLARNGHRSEALRIYQHLVEALADELGVEPSEETVAIQRQIAAGEVAERYVVATFRCAYPFPAPGELIGRDVELGLLERVLAGGRTGGKAALVGAPAGTGKSALVGELVKRAQAQGILCLAGGCYEERGAVPLGPFHDALVDFLLAQPPDRVRADLGNNVTDLARVVPELRYQLELADEPSRESPQIDRMRVFGAIHSWLRNLAQRGPLVLCLEDLHASDEATLHLFHYLVRQTRRLPLVLIGTYRSDEVDAGQPLAQMLAAVSRERLAENVQLAPLDRLKTNRLVGSLLDGSASEPLADSLYTATGGNPLFVEQLVLALSEGGQLHQRGGLWHGQTEMQGSPPIVGEVIAQRLQRLTQSCRDTLAVAAVFGHSLDYEVLLEAVQPPHESALLTDLDQAISASVLQEIAGGYAFRHVLLRDAVYWALSTPRRMLLHGRAGELLERLRGARADDYGAELAHHFTLAGQAAPVRAKALHYSMQAGRHAAELSSYPEALAHYSRAWELIEREGALADPHTRLEALEGRGWAEVELARWTETAGSFRAALALSQDRIHRGRAHGLIAFAHVHTGHLQEGLDECDSGLVELTDVAGPEAVGARLTLQQLIGFIWNLQGRYREVVRLGQQMLRDAATLEQPRTLVLAHNVIAWGFSGQGQAQPAREHYQAAIAAGERAGEKVLLATAYENLGRQSYLNGRFGEAREELGHALALYRDSANELRAVNALHHLCRVWVAQGELARAREQVEQALEQEVRGRERWAADAQQILGSIHALVDNWEAARACFEEALEIRARVGVMIDTVDSTVSLGLVRRHQGRWQEASAAFSEAARMADSIDPTPAAILAHRNMGRLHILQRDRDSAAIEIEQAVALAEAMPETLEYAPTLLVAAELRAMDSDFEAALALAKRSLECAKPLEQLIEAHILLAHIAVGLGDPALATAHATEAVGQAQNLGSRRLLALAQLAAARAARGRAPRRAAALL
jgi:DNA-binding SARP family transcriptional activator/Tfp pilus assembly protein PilF